MNDKSLFVRVTGAALVALGAALAAAPALADVPGTLTYQGRLFDTGGKPISDSLSVTFSFYDKVGDASPAYSEKVDVTFDDGYFAATLGAADPPGLKALLDGSVKYVGITVGADEEMKPRAPVQSVPYAMVAGDVTGDIHPTSVTVNGTVVIDKNGAWTGSPSGLAGPAGAIGPVGPTGPAGDPGMMGPVGPTGPIGPTGAAGSTGPVGPSGVVATYTNSGLGGNPTAVLDFLGVQTPPIPVAAGQKVFVVATKAFGSLAAGGGTDLDLHMCFKSTAAGAAINSVGNAILNQQVPQNLRMPVTLSWSFVGLPADTYTFGLCGASGSAASWNFNEYGYVSAMLVN